MRLLGTITTLLPFYTKIVIASIAAQHHILPFAFCRKMAIQFTKLFSFILASVHDPPPQPIEPGKNKFTKLYSKFSLNRKYNPLILFFKKSFKVSVSHIFQLFLNKNSKTD
jgi:hypothetical protein